MLGASMIVLIGDNAFTQQSHDEAIIYADVSKQLKGYIDIYIHIKYTDHNSGNHHQESNSNHHQESDSNYHHHHHDNNQEGHQYPSESSRICVGQYYSNSSSSSMSIPIVDVQYDNDDEVRVVYISKMFEKMSVFSDIISNVL